MTGRAQRWRVGCLLALLIAILLVWRASIFLAGYADPKWKRDVAVMAVALIELADSQAVWRARTGRYTTAMDSLGASPPEHVDFRIDVANDRVLSIIGTHRRLTGSCAIIVTPRTECGPREVMQCEELGPK